VSEAIQFKHLGPQWRAEVQDKTLAVGGTLGDVFFTLDESTARVTSSPGITVIFEFNTAAQIPALVATQETDAFKDMVTNSAGVEAFIVSVGIVDTKLASFSNAVLTAMIAAAHDLDDTATDSLTFDINTTGFKVTLDTANMVSDLTIDLSRWFNFIEAIIPLQDAQTIFFSAQDQTSPTQLNNTSPFTITATSFELSFPTDLEPFRAYNDSNIDEFDCWRSSGDPAGIPEVISIDFGIGNSKLIDEYRFLSRNIGGQQNEPSDWTLEGSNLPSPDITDDLDWGVLDTQSSQPDLGQNNLSVLYVFTNLIAFRHYRFKFTGSNGNRIALANIQLFNSTSLLVDQNAIFQSNNIENPVPHFYDITQDKIFSLLDGVEVT